MYVPAAEFLQREQHPDGVYYFSTAPDPVTGAVWCPDCVDAKPTMEGQVIPAVRNSGLPFASVDVGARPEWVNPDHPLRKHPVFRVLQIPTLMLVVGGQKVAELVEEKIWDKGHLAAFLGELEGQGSSL